MTEALTEAWSDAVGRAVAELPPGPGGSGVVEVVVSGGESSRRSTRWVVEDGRLVGVTLDGQGPDPEVTIPASRSDVEAIIAGTLDPSVAFMRGDLKPEGSARALFALLSALARDDCRAALSA